MVQINGESVDAAGKVLKKYLEENNYITEGIAVECNEKIIPKPREQNNNILKSKDLNSLKHSAFIRFFILSSFYFNSILLKHQTERTNAVINEWN